MKKRILLASAMGIGGGLLYFLTKRGGGNHQNTKPGNEASANTERTDGEDPDHRLSSMKALDDPERSKHEQPELVIDDQGTDQSEASEILKGIRDSAFEGSDAKLALALGRPEEEIESWTNGAGTIDGDVIMKARGLAAERGLHIE